MIFAGQPSLRCLLTKSTDVNSHRYSGRGSVTSQPVSFQPRTRLTAGGGDVCRQDMVDCGDPFQGRQAGNSLGWIAGQIGSRS
jgi:hypothetical protein